MEHYESYSPIPVYLWRECNGLYAYAQQKQFEDMDIFSNNYFHCLPSIEKTYARACLMSLSDPYHLSTGEHWHLFSYLGRWVHLVEFSDDIDDFQNNRCFVVELDSQKKPDYSSQYKDDLDEESICFMLTHDMIRQLKYHIDSLTETRELPEGFYPDLRPASAQALLEHMSQHWNAKVERRGRRYPILTKLDIVWGIPAIHKLLTQHSFNSNSTHWDAQTIESHLEKEHPVSLSWDAANVSDGGLGISSHKNVSHHLRVGELVIIREYIDQKPSYRWRPAICRWLFGDDNQGTRAGLEFIEGELKPGRLHNKLAKSRNAMGQLALLLNPKVKSINANPIMLATRGTFQIGRSFILRHDQVAEDIKARTRSLVTPCVEEFSYQSFQTVEIEEAADEENMELPWTSIPDFSDMEDSDQNEINLDSVRLPGDH